MRERFELCTKVIGLLLLCGVVVLTFTAIVTFLHRPDYGTSQLQGVMMPHPLGSQLQTKAQLVTSHCYGWFLVHMLVLAVGLGALGVYLMRSDNLAVRLCYPDTNSGSRAETLSHAQIGSPLAAKPEERKATENRSDSRYAPPGYSQ
ncbi:MAG: hypothetical protein GX448_04050 [Planctomycetes bacterium]|nr:hypothetical protein [Planctomycetota bacterium]